MACLEHGLPSNGCVFCSPLKRWKEAHLTTGLRFDDLIPEETPIVEEALSRLSPREYSDRLFRIRRALHLSMAKDTLPEWDWVSAKEVSVV